MTLRLPDSGADISIDGRRHAPSAIRNQDAILEVLRAEAPAKGKLLEIASGSGQHAAAGARALPGLIWQPTDANPDNLTSINAWRAHDPQPNLRPPVVLDAAIRTGQSLARARRRADHQPVAPDPRELPQPYCRNAARALAPDGKLMVYGPFLRDGKTTSDGDAAFDASLRAQDPSDRLQRSGLGYGAVRASGPCHPHIEMPANNLMLIGTAS